MHRGRYWRPRGHAGAMATAGDLDREKQRLLQQSLKGTQKQLRRSRLRGRRKIRRGTGQGTVCADTHTADAFYARVCILLLSVLCTGQGQLQQAQHRSLLSHSHPVQSQSGPANRWDAGGLGKWNSHSCLAIAWGWKPSLGNNEWRNLYNLLNPG